MNIKVVIVCLFSFKKRMLVKLLFFTQDILMISYDIMLFRIFHHNTYDLRRDDVYDIYIKKRLIL